MAEARLASLGSFEAAYFAVVLIAACWQLILILRE